MFFVCCLGAAHSAMAQASAADNNTGATVATATSGPRTDQRIERIQIEDAGSRIDELRVGGETRSITVTPKGGMPAYEVVPASANRAPVSDRNSSAASGGTRVWKILGF